MGRKIFISYKYGDSLVLALEGISDTRVRDYVDVMQAKLEEFDHINKGEKDGESLEDFKDSTIETHLKNKIFDSSITIVMISKGMKDSQDDNAQWIPWEVSYSLREVSREDKTSRMNAVLTVTLPDEFGSYSYFIEDNTCPTCKSRTLHTNRLFDILKNNMFNKKEPETVSCSSHNGSGTVYKGNYSYIPAVKWSDFMSDPSKHLDIAETIRGNSKEYNISKTV